MDVDAAPLISALRAAIRVSRTLPGFEGAGDAGDPELPRLWTRQRQHYLGGERSGEREDALLHRGSRWRGRRAIVLYKQSRFPHALAPRKCRDPLGVPARVGPVLCVAAAARRLSAVRGGFPDGSRDDGNLWTPKQCVPREGDLLVRQVRLESVP